jgi:hypothetical protein
MRDQVASQGERVSVTNLPLAELLLPGADAFVFVDDTFKGIHTFHQGVHPRAIGETHIMVARTIEQVTTLTGVEVEEDAWDNDGFFFKTSREEV